MKKFQDPISVTIKGYTSKGDGKAKNFEVIGALEGEEAHVKILKRSGRDFVAKVTELLSKSPHRVEPVCQHAFSCGGCRLQHLVYSEQLAIKQKYLKELFPHIEIAPIVPCDDPFYGRNKMEFTFGEEGKIGLIEAGSRGRVIDIQECHICPPSFMPILKSIRAWWQEVSLPPFSARSGSGILRTLTIRSSLKGDLQIVLTVMQKLSLEHIASLERHLPFGSLFMRVHHAQKGVPSSFELIHLMGEERLVEEFEGFKLAVSPDSFLQPNPKQARKIYQKVASLLALKGTETVLDLYAGVGAFGLALSPFSKKIISIEIVESALLDAKVSMEISGSSNIEFIQSDAIPWLKSYEGDVDIVVVDPPRAGLGRVLIERLLQLKPDKVVYVSCNPKSQAEDLTALLELYEPIVMHPVDQFPHTFHLENILLLKRKI